MYVRVYVRACVCGGGGGGGECVSSVCMNQGGRAGTRVFT